MIDIIPFAGIEWGKVKVNVTSSVPLASLLLWDNEAVVIVPPVVVVSLTSDK